MWVEVGIETINFATKIMAKIYPYYKGKSKSSDLRERIFLEQLYKLCYVQKKYYPLRAENLHITYDQFYEIFNMQAEQYMISTICLNEGISEILKLLNVIEDKKIPIILESRYKKIQNFRMFKYQSRINIKIQNTERLERQIQRLPNPYVIQQKQRTHQIQHKEIKIVKQEKQDIQIIQLKFFNEGGYGFGTLFKRMRLNFEYRQIIIRFLFDLELNEFQEHYEQQKFQIAERQVSRKIKQFLDEMDVRIDQIQKMRTVIYEKINELFSKHLCRIVKETDKWTNLTQNLFQLLMDEKKRQNRQYKIISIDRFITSFAQRSTSRDGIYQFQQDITSNFGYFHTEIGSSVVKFSKELPKNNKKTQILNIKQITNWRCMGNCLLLFIQVNFAKILRMNRQEIFSYYERLNLNEYEKYIEQRDDFYVIFVQKRTWGRRTINKDYEVQTIERRKFKLDLTIFDKLNEDGPKEEQLLGQIKDILASGKIPQPIDLIDKYSKTFSNQKDYQAMFQTFLKLSMKRRDSK